MNSKVCKYSIIRFQPDADNDEFANIGIVLYVPTAQRLIYKILRPNQHKRITDFFKPMKISKLKNNPIFFEFPNEGNAFKYV